MSSVARAGNIGQTNYAASKAGVVALTTTWAKELGRFGIRVGAIAPGVISTAMTDTMKSRSQTTYACSNASRALRRKRRNRPYCTIHNRKRFFTGRAVEIDGGIRL
ncbi:SDR family oxidoreductase [Pseudoalteromonas sp. B193]